MHSVQKLRTKKHDDVYRMGNARKIVNRYNRSKLFEHA